MMAEDTGDQTDDAMRAAQQLKIAERRAAVLDYTAAHPRATHQQIADALGCSRVTVQRDLAAAVAGIMDRARVAYLATMIARNEQIIEAHLPLALKGKTRSAEIVLAADEATAKRLGLNEPIAVDITHRLIAAATARGIDPADAVAEAERIVAAMGASR